MLTIRVHHYHHDGDEPCSGGEVLAALVSIGRKLEQIMATQQELIDTLAAVQAQQTKTAGEIVALQGSVNVLHETIAALEEQLAQSGAVSPELEAAVAAVKAKAQEVDDLIPDAPTE